MSLVTKPDSLRHASFQLRDFTAPMYHWGVVSKGLGRRHGLGFELLPTDDLLVHDLDIDFITP